MSLPRDDDGNTHERNSHKQNNFQYHFFMFLFLIINIAADWELRKQSLDSKMPSQMRRGADIAVENRQQGAPTQFNHRQPTIAHVETYQTTTTTMTKNSMADHRRPSQQMDSSLSVTPTATSPQHNIINNVQEAARAHVHQEDRNLVNSGKFQVYFYYHFLLSSSYNFDCVENIMNIQVKIFAFIILHKSIIFILAFVYKIKNNIITKYYIFIYIK